VAQLVGHQALEAGDSRYPIEVAAAEGLHPQRRAGL
jgi:hypothetical protein